MWFPDSETRVTNSTPMSYDRALELRDECVADLAEAHRQRHRDWISTLTWRLATLDRLVEKKRARLSSADPRRVEGETA